MKRGTAHADLRGEVINAQRPSEVTLQPIDCPRYLMTLTSRRRQLAQTCTLIAHEQTVDDFPLDDRRKDRNVLLFGKISAQKNATPAQIALAWLLARKPWIVPIPGTTKLHRLEENIGAVAVELTSGDLRNIESAAAQITIEGARYPEALEKRTGL